MVRNMSEVSSPAPSSCFNNSLFKLYSRDEMTVSGSTLQGNILENAVTVTGNILIVEMQPGNYLRECSDRRKRKIAS